LGNVDTEQVEELGSITEMDDATPSRRRDCSFPDQCLKNRHTETPRQVVVAGSSLGQG
jgi:hypothetical protein